MSKTLKHWLLVYMPKLLSMAMLYVHLSQRMFSLCLIYVLLSICFHFCHHWPTHFSVFAFLSFKIMVQFFTLPLFFSFSHQNVKPSLNWCIFSVIFLAKATVLEKGYSYTTLANKIRGGESIVQGRQFVTLFSVPRKAQLSPVSCMPYNVC